MDEICGVDVLSPIIAANALDAVLDEINLIETARRV